MRLCSNQHVMWTIGKKVVMVMSVCVLMLPMMAQGTLWYVDAARPDDNGGGDTWATAKKSIQAAVTEAGSGDTILVAKGTYRSIVTDNKRLVIQSVSGAENTIISGNRTRRCATLGEAEHYFNTIEDPDSRFWFLEEPEDFFLVWDEFKNFCFYWNTPEDYFRILEDSADYINTVLIGFTLQNGKVDSGGGIRGGLLMDCVLKDNEALCGGGASYSILIRCTVSSNTAAFDDEVFDTEQLGAGKGGGVYQSTVVACNLERNSSVEGGGAYYSALSRSVLDDNEAEFGGGACYSDLMDKCRLINNWAHTAPQEVTSGSAPAAGPANGGRGGAVLSCTLEECTLEDNVADIYGGAAYSSSLVSCDVSRNSAVYGGGACYSTLEDCLLEDNQVYEGDPVYEDNVLVLQGGYGGGACYSDLERTTVIHNEAVEGGGVYSSTLIDCVLMDNRAELGGGACYGDLQRCTLNNNVAFDGNLDYSDYLYYKERVDVEEFEYRGNGGGAYYSTLDNCLVTANWAVRGGGVFVGSLTNCTLAGNTAETYGGGVWFSTLENCIVWKNPSLFDANYFSSTFTYSCTEPLPTGVGNIRANPQFVDEANGDYRLRGGSPCLDVGRNFVAFRKTDLAGNPRIGNGTVDMGAYEGSHDGFVVTGRVVGDGGLAPRTAAVAAGASVTFRATATRRPFRYFLLNGTVVSVSSEFTLYNIQADMEVTAVFETRTWHVDASRPDDNGDGASWWTAKKNIQAAVELAVDEDVIVVAAGEYGPIDTGNKKIVIQSVDGAKTTVIDGSGKSRCGKLGDSPGHFDAVLDGFTLRNGLAVTGGGVWYGTVRNCILIGNRAYDGGGAYQSRLVNCLLTDNSAIRGGGAVHCRLTNCTVVGNSARDWGGGTCYGVLINSIVWENQALWDDNYCFSQMTHSCSAPLFWGGGNIADEPRFVDAINEDFRLREGSPCLNSGRNELANGEYDLTGNPRIAGGSVDMGAQEGMVSGFVISGRVLGAGRLSPMTATVAAGGAVTFTAEEDGRPFKCFSFNGVEVSEAPVFTLDHVQADGVITVVFEDKKWSVPAEGVLQDVVDSALDGDTIEVSPGNYGPITTKNRAITIQSTKGASQTFIQGDSWNRCATLGSQEGHDDTVLIGFTLFGGNAPEGGGACYGTLIHCVLVNNWAAMNGGGAFGSKLINCLLYGNIAGSSGGGAANCQMSHCTVALNKANRGGGGGVDGCTLTNSIVWDNSSLSEIDNNCRNSVMRSSCTDPLPIGPGNIGDDPLFVKPLAGDFRLQPGSPCQEVGDNALLQVEKDLDRKARVNGVAVDLGSYEYQLYFPLVIEPDRGVEGDFITSLNDGERLTLRGRLPGQSREIRVSKGDDTLVEKETEFFDQTFEVDFRLGEGQHELTVTYFGFDGSVLAQKQTVIIDNTAPGPVTGLGIRPDHGQSDNDNVTWLPDGESLMLSFLVSETPTVIELTWRRNGAVIVMEPTLIELPVGVGRQVLQPLQLPGGGVFEVAMSSVDLAGNRSGWVALPFVVDDVPLTVSDCQLARDAINIIFSDAVVEDEFSLDQIELRFNGTLCAGLTLTRLDDRSFAVGNVLQGVEEDGQFALEITLDGLHKAISGQPASGSHSETMDLFFESLGYAWEQGWNAICLPFVSVTHETAEALAGMTVFKLDEGGYVRNGEVPLQTAMWVYCSDPALVPEIQGLGPEKENRGVDQLPVGAWSFHGPLQEARLPSGHTAWEWSASQYRLATDLQPGRAYWIYRFADN